MLRQAPLRAVQVMHTILSRMLMFRCLVCDERFPTFRPAYVPPEKLWITPDCGFFQLPRWLAFQKLQNMVRGVTIVRKELEG